MIWCIKEFRLSVISRDRVRAYSLSPDFRNETERDCYGGIDLWQFRFLERFVQYEFCAV